MLMRLVAHLAAGLPLAMAGSPGGDGQAPGGAALWGQFAYIPIVIAIFYVVMIRPQQQKAKEHQDMLEALKKGDEVLTSGGLYGRVHAVADQVVTLEIAPNVRVRVARSRIEGREGKDSKDAKDKDKDKDAKGDAKPSE